MFSFLRDAMATNVTAALGRLSSSRGFQEVRSRGSDGPIEIELKSSSTSDARSQASSRTRWRSTKEGRPVVAREILKYRRGSAGKPWHFLDFTKGVGAAVTNEMESSPTNVTSTAKSRPCGARTSSRSKGSRGLPGFRPRSRWAH